jgi:hypothetical protein
MAAEPVAVGADYVKTVTAAGAFAVRVDDETVVPLLELDPEHVAAIARLTGITWAELVDAPTSDLGAALALVAAAEQAADADPRRPTSVAELMARFVRLPARNGRRS